MGLERKWTKKVSGHSMSLTSKQTRSSWSFSVFIIIIDITIFLAEEVNESSSYQLGANSTHLLKLPTCQHRPIENRGNLGAILADAIAPSGSSIHTNGSYVGLDATKIRRGRSRRISDLGVLAVCLK